MAEELGKKLTKLTREFGAEHSAVQITRIELGDVLMLLVVPKKGLQFSFPVPRPWVRFSLPLALQHAWPMRPSNHRRSWAPHGPIHRHQVTIDACVSPSATDQTGSIEEVEQCQNRLDRRSNVRHCRCVQDLCNAPLILLKVNNPAVHQHQLCTA